MNYTINKHTQEFIAGTNGNFYVNLIGTLTEYPIPEIPLPKVSNGIMLDIGSGWGRWMVAAAQKGYIPIGIDIKKDSSVASRQVLNDLGFHGYTVVADLKKLPFQTNTFDKVWSFSVIQHTHRKRAYSCLQEIHRILQPNSETVLEFPTKHGFWNKFVIARRTDKQEEDNYDSWCVRYYDIAELKSWTETIFGNFDYESHCYFGIGTQAIDLQFVSWKYKPIVLSSLMLTAMSKVISPLKTVADSIYMRAKKEQSQFNNTHIQSFLEAHQANPTDNLNMISLLSCPISGDGFVYDSSKKLLVCKEASWAYPVQDNIPILLETEAIKVR